MQNSAAAAAAKKNVRGILVQWIEEIVCVVLVYGTKTIFQPWKILSFYRKNVTMDIQKDFRDIDGLSCNPFVYLFVFVCVCVSLSREKVRSEKKIPWLTTDKTNARSFTFC